MSRKLFGDAIVKPIVSRSISNLQHLFDFFDMLLLRANKLANELFERDVFPAQREKIQVHFEAMTLKLKTLLQNIEDGVFVGLRHWLGTNGGMPSHGRDLFANRRGMGECLVCLVSKKLHDRNSIGSCNH